MATPRHVIDEAVEWANEVETETAKQAAAQELKLKAMQSAARNRRRR